MKLDAKSIAALKLDDKNDVIVFDDSMPGFGHRMRRSAGGKVLRSWIVQYKRAGASRRLLLGSAEVLSAEQARQQAKKVLGKVALGEDPQADRVDRRGKDLLTLRSQADEYLAAKEHELAKRTFTECDVTSPIRAISDRFTSSPSTPSRGVTSLHGCRDHARARQPDGGKGTGRVRQLFHLGHAHGAGRIQSDHRKRRSGRGWRPRPGVVGFRVGRHLACLRRRRLRPHRPAAAPAAGGGPRSATWRGASG